MNTLKVFVLGYASTLIFHQGLVVYLHTIGFLPRLPYSLTPTAPFQIPQVISLAFWGGVWGIPLWLVIRRMKNLKILADGAGLRRASFRVLLHGSWYLPSRGCRLPVGGIR